MDRLALRQKGFHAFGTFSGFRRYEIDSREHDGPTTTGNACRMTYRIMIVEDEFLIAMDLEDLLSEAGFEVVGIATDTEAALALARETPVNAAIMDVNLARGTCGIETARRLRAELDIPSLFVSAQINEKLRSVAADAKPLGFVTKPYMPDEIVAKLGAA